MLDYHRQETAITTCNTSLVTQAGKVLFYTPIGLLAREE